jgi:hypothetical protein
VINGKGEVANGADCDKDEDFRQLLAGVAMGMMFLLLAAMGAVAHVSSMAA